MESPTGNDPGEVLPVLYAAWMEELLGRGIPAETEACCDDCAMCREGAGRPAESTYYFEAGTKCCTFIPDLPNFLVGRALADGDPGMARGRATLEKRLSSRVSVTPLGVGRHPTFDALYDHVTAGTGFGRNRSIRCPHFLDEAGGLCGIWRHREAICATWFCKHVRGGVGQRFWRTLQQLLAAVEHDLVRWCILQLDLGATALNRLFHAPSDSPRTDPLDDGRIDGVPETPLHQANWGSWAGREQAFYTQCAGLVGALKWRNVAEICAPEVRIFAELTREAFQHLVSPIAPGRLRASPFQVCKVGLDSSSVAAYSPLDPNALIYQHPTLGAGIEAARDWAPRRRPFRETIGRREGDAGVQRPPLLPHRHSGVKGVGVKKIRKSA